VKRSWKKIPGVLLIGLVFIFSLAFQEVSDNKLGEIYPILDKNCSVSGCHQGNYPPKGMNLERENFLDSVLNVPSQEIPSLNLVDTENPEESYLLMKIKGNPNIKGTIMPAYSPPLSSDDIQIIQDWIYSLKGKEIKKKLRKKKEVKKPIFWGTRIVNLPTNRSIGKNQWLFRISHRFFPSVKQGYDVFYGLDGPASVLISMGYGLTDNLNLTLARANVSKEFESSLGWNILNEGKIKGLPLSVAAGASINFITLSVPKKSVFRWQNLRYNLHTSLAFRANDSLSLLLVPGYTFNTDPSDPSSQGTFYLGTGGRVMIWDNFSLLVEWIPVLSGYQNTAWGWGLGGELKVGGHVFQLFAVNTTGIVTSQFVPGGDLQLSKGDFRLGFNIFRWF